MSQSDNDVEMDESGDAQQDNLAIEKKKVYIPGVSRELKEGEELEYDPEAYRLFHTFETDLPCLSFDVVADALGAKRETYPITCYLVGGTQAEKAEDNELVIMRLSNMHPIKQPKVDNDNSDDDEDSDEEEENEERDKAKDPILQAAVIPQFGDVNRVKSQTIGSSSVCAVWNDQGKVQIWNLSAGLGKLSALDEKASASIKLTNEKPLFSFSGHSASGFALGWSSLKEGCLASGDLHRKIFHWQMAEAGKWVVDQRALVGHEGSVEDLEWSVTEEPLLVSCSVDRSIRLWDIRAPSQQACVHTVKNAHESDVNVISWNRHEPLIASGGDDAVLKIWSLKTIQYDQPVAMFKHHKKPITSARDDQCTIWDLAVEPDDIGGLQRWMMDQMCRHSCFSCMLDRRKSRKFTGIPSTWTCYNYRSGWFPRVQNHQCLKFERYILIHLFVEIVVVDCCVSVK
uniref:Glutamate-rich WD repeat-containing protein 1 n=1 Tax=Ditylenchus dipsaci TaxID=166011 RepID=A0A915EGF5_9BILA